MLSRWPRYLSHGPAIEMWSVVHLPWILMSTGAFSMFLPSHGAKGLSSWRRSDLGFTTTVSFEPSAGGAWYVSSPASNPRWGSSSPFGGWNRNPFGSASVMGLKVRSPAIAIAVTISGDATNECVSGLPSARPVKLRLNDVMIELATPFESERFHCPMHGPHALASTVPPTCSKVCMIPSRAIVARTCSEPGVMVNCALALMPAPSACLASDAARDMSSYEEFVHEPMSPTLSSFGYLFLMTASLNLESGCARSGVNGPLMCGSSVERSIS
eukprot:Amastigsp_a512855_9.p3 type:complete len:271 gc:universal Amastigsp_a512855_9:1834-1022(-)